MKDIAEQLDAKAQPAAVQPDADLLSFGYAPGNYESFCLTCEQRMTGVDKRCHCCRPCAKEKWGAAEKAKINQRQVPEGMALYKGEFVTARMVVERLDEAERLLRICTDGREAYIKSVNTVLEITKFLGTADSDEWPTREEAEKRAADLLKWKQREAEIESLRSRLASTQLELTHAANACADQQRRAENAEAALVAEVAKNGRHAMRVTIAQLEARLAEADAHGKAQQRWAHEWRDKHDALTAENAALREERALIIQRAENAEAALVESDALLREMLAWKVAIECIAPELGGAIMTLARIGAHLAREEKP